MIKIISERMTGVLRAQMGLLSASRSAVPLVGATHRQYHPTDRAAFGGLLRTPVGVSRVTILQPPKQSGSCLTTTDTWAQISSGGGRGQSEAHEQVHNLITKSPKKVFVFMKGVPEGPACGYSNAVVQILNAYRVDYDTFDVLSDEKIRQEVKSYSSWPTIPQVYVDGSFVGGCDILIQMHQNNELEALFEGKTKSDAGDGGGGGGDASATAKKEK